jgi:hypothetical protein
VFVPFGIRPAALDPPGPGSSGLTVAPAKITLRTNVGSTTSPTPVTAKNPGSRPVIVLAVHLAGDINAFKLGDGTCARGITVPAGQTCDLTVSFDAYRSGSIHGTIAIDYMSGGKVKAGAASLTGAQTSTPGNSLKAATATLLKQINIDRGKLHLSPYVLDPTESKCSTLHSKYMAQIENLTHVGFPADVCVPHKHAAENLAETPLQSLPQAVLSMQHGMISEGPCAHNPCTPGDLVNHSHWVFLMSRVFTHVGIGLYVHGREVWLTEDFFTP